MIAALPRGKRLRTPFRIPACSSKGGPHGNARKRSYVLQGIVPSQIAAALVGPKVVDLYDDNGDLFSSAQVAQMESGGGNVLGYFSIGEAENFRSYWSSLPSSVLGPQNPDWPGDYQVAYWTPQWLTVSENYIQTMINQGYKGAFFDVVDEAETSWAKKNAPNGDSEGAMVTLIQELANYAHAREALSCLDAAR
jgi:cysteinyl-tRNA synthetase